MMQNKNLIFLIAGALVFGGLIAILGSNTASNEKNELSNSAKYSANVLVSQENSFDFGTISMKNGKVSHIFEIQNKENEPVIIEKVYTSCMCTIAYISTADGKKYGGFGMPGHTSANTKIEVKPGEKTSVEVVFDPAAHGPSGVGLAQRSVYLETNSAKSPKLEFAFQAMVTR